MADGRFIVLGELALPLSPELLAVLEDNGVHRFYLHQAMAIDAIRSKKHVIVSTSTASGKSLIYQVPLMEALLEDPSTRALFIFPTKSLAQDQQRSLQAWMASVPSLESVKVATYDGDTPFEQRARIRATANVIITNPDMIHHSIIPNARDRWQDFFPRLRFIVIDEIHVYHDIFGAHVSLILRRMLRVCCHIFNNQDIRVISCSATLKEPDLHMHRLVGPTVENIVSIEEDGAPKKVVLWNPPLTDRPTPGVRRSAIAESADLLVYLVSRNVRTIVFCKLRKTCELLMKQVRELLKDRHDMLSKIMSYRGGYTPASRRLIEQQMFRNELLAVISTNALELGIDIGSLDAVMMVGIPWSLAAFWQQSGRAGRRHNESLTLVVADQNPLDQFYASHPQQLFTRSIPPLILEIEENQILEDHLQCAAYELPIDLLHDGAYFGPRLGAICTSKLKFIPESNFFRPHPSKIYPHPPSHHVQIRGIIENETIAVVDVSNPNDHRILEELEPARVPFEAYEGAIFIHKGITYLVKECNLDKQFVKVQMVRVDWITRQRDYTNVNSVSTQFKRDLGPTWVSYGEVERETVVFGYYKLDKRGRILDTYEINMDPILRKGTGLWIDLPSDCVRELETRDIDPMSAIHATAHLMISQIAHLLSHSPLISGISTECKSPFATRHRPTRVILYESYAGILRNVYQGFERLLSLCYDCISQCPCKDGCPHCIYISTCTEENLLCSKIGALVVLHALLHSQKPRPENKFVLVGR
ncbi:DEAD-domain-containing protein [Hesseltinella vesiculosa]|uniref:DEAD-domain-containing protein n=1 Tax=Hesseltinella vesiculosa TaxID=101127 RepID=A0A1X2GA53_9FUNG|nr:DEAD-domain-containing protein [Hesseltinella vesiculosa]